jgi:Zn-dependent protease with chaperone function
MYEQIGKNKRQTALCVLLFFVTHPPIAERVAALEKVSYARAS